jgi:hypothetical protein
LCNLNQELKKQIEEIEKKNEKKKIEYEYQIEQQRSKNKSLQDAIMYLREHSEL